MFEKIYNRDQENILVPLVLSQLQNMALDIVYAVDYFSNSIYIFCYLYYFFNNSMN